MNVDDHTDLPCAWLLACIALHCPLCLCLYCVACTMSDSTSIGLIYFHAFHFFFSACSLYFLDFLFTAQIQDGPLTGVKGVQTTIGEYTIDDSEPVRQKVCCLSCPIAVV